MQWCVLVCERRKKEAGKQKKWMICGGQNNCGQVLVLTEKAG